MKKLNINNREIKKATPIKDSEIKEPKEKRKFTKKSKKVFKAKAVNLVEEDFEKVNRFLEEQNLTFGEFIIAYLKKEKII
jgi:uncharacterized protein YozE (UPF0346 family)